MEGGRGEGVRRLVLSQVRTNALPGNTAGGEGSPTMDGEERARRERERKPERGVQAAVLIENFEFRVQRFLSSNTD